MKLFKNNIDMKEFNEVLEQLDKVPNINQGGCAICAYGLWLWLKKQNAIKRNVNVVYLSTQDTEYQINQHALDTNNFNNVKACTHALLKIGRTYYDSSGNVNEYVKSYHESNFLSIPQNKTEIFLKHSINTKNWSVWFDRKEGIPMIENILGIDLSMIEIF